MQDRKRTSGKQSARAREAVKNGRRQRRNGSKRWQRHQAVMKQGPGGTDKPSTRNNGKAPKLIPPPEGGWSSVPAGKLGR